MQDNNLFEQTANLEVTEDIQPTKPKKSLAVLILQIVTAVLFALTTAVIIWSIISGVVSDMNNESGWKLGKLGMAIILIIYGILGYGATAITSIVGLVLCCSKKFKSTTTKGQKIYFIVFIALPIVAWFVALIAINLIPTP